MVVILLENTPNRLRGEMTRWLLEPHPNVFVGHVSARVRDKLWEKCIKSCGGGGVILIHSTNTEQRFAMRMHGSTRRELVEFEGIQLVRVPHRELNTANAKPPSELNLPK